MFIKVSDPKSAEQFTNETRNGYWVVLYYANWCPHCQIMKPEWETFAEKYSNNQSINVAELESEHIDSVGSEHRQNVEGFPTIVCMNKGKPISKFDGPRTSNDIDSFAKENYSSIKGVTKVSSNINSLLRKVMKKTKKTKKTSKKTGKKTSKKMSKKTSKKVKKMKKSSKSKSK